MITDPVFKYWVFLLLLYFKRYWDKSLTLNIKSEQNQLSDTQNSVLFAFLSNLLIFKIYNKEFLKSKSFCLTILAYPQPTTVDREPKKEKTDLVFSKS